MKLIAHRGNIDGPNPEFENSPLYINHAFSLGYDVEIDVWYSNDSIWLGHDIPQYYLNHDQFTKLLHDHRIWWHAKDYTTLQYLLSHGRQIKVFAHETDRYGLVNGGYIWTSDFTISVESNNRTVWIVPNKPADYLSSFDTNIYGICADEFPEHFKQMYL